MVYVVSAANFSDFLDNNKGDEHQLPTFEFKNAS